MMTNEKMNALGFVELTDEELQNVVGGKGKIANTIYNLLYAIVSFPAGPILG